MSYKVFFRLPNDWSEQWSWVRVELASVIKALPDDWGSVSGDIEALPGFAPEPDRVFQRECSPSGLMVSDVAHAFEGGAFHVAIVDSKSEPDLLGIFAEGKRPGFINFRGCRALPDLGFRNLRDFAAHYVGLGYRGCLAFRAKGTVLRMTPGDCRTYCLLNFPLKCDPDRDRPGITLGWDERSGGSREDIAPLVERCRELRFEEA